MAKFIEVTNALNSKILLNTDTILYVSRALNGCYIHLKEPIKQNSSSTQMTVPESYDEIRKALIG